MDVLVINSLRGTDTKGLFAEKHAEVVLDSLTGLAKATNKPSGGAARTTNLTAAGTTDPDTAAPSTTVDTIASPTNSRETASTTKTTVAPTSMQGTSTSTSLLTKREVQQITNELKECYRQSLRRITVDPLNFYESANFDEIYTNLSMININHKKHKTQIKLEDLLTRTDDRLSKRILIQGEGGVGKTTLCSKIAWDWCNGKILQDLDIVLVVPLRDVRVSTTIGGIVKEYISDTNEVSENQIDDYISRSLRNILLVFDGYDEFSGEITEKSSSEVIRILRFERYKSCKVIVTTRPWRADEFTMDKFLAKTYTFLGVEGFNRDSLQNYIRKYFQIEAKEDHAKDLIIFMEESDNIASNMARFPIFCAMFCLIWSDVSKKKQREILKLPTFSEIFGNMISFLKRHYTSKANENLESEKAVENFNEASEAIQDIGEIAIGGLLSRDCSFHEEKFKKCRKSMLTCCRVGVLTIEKGISKHRESIVSFPHKLFQEYIAGVHMSTLFEDHRSMYDKLKNKLLRRKEEFRYLLYFSSHMNKNLGHDIITGLLESDDQHFCVDVAFECHTVKACEAVGRRWKSYKLSACMSDHTKSGVAFMVKSDQTQSVQIDGMICGITVSRDLAEMLCSSSALHRVEIRGSQFHEDFYAILAAGARKSQIKDLKLSRLDEYTKPSLSSGDNLAKWVCAMPHLSLFSMESVKLPDEFISTAADLASSCQIQKFQLSRVSVTSRSPSFGKNFARWICTMPRLMLLSINNVDLPGEFFSTAATISSNCEIQDLKLSSLSEYSDPLPSLSSGENLARWVCTMPNLSLVSVESVELPDEFFSTAASLASSCMIQNLQLSHVNEYDDNFPSRSFGRNFAIWICTMPNLSLLSVNSIELPKEFFSSAATLASKCEIQDLKISSLPEYSKRYPLSMFGENLAKWVCTMPRLTHFSVKSIELPEEFFSTAATLASSCMIQELKLSLFSEYNEQFSSPTSGENFSKWLCSMPRLSAFKVEGIELPDKFSTATILASSCKGDSESGSPERKRRRKAGIRGEKFTSSVPPRGKKRTTKC